MEKKRVWEIDFLRAFAVILMIIYHFAYDLYMLGLSDIDFHNGFWYWFQKLSWTFIFVSGISSGFSKNPIKRGIKVFGFGVALTIGSYIFIGNQFILFGVLHLLGFSLICSSFLRRLNKWLLLLISFFIISLNFYVSGLSTDSYWLVPLGIEKTGFRPFDNFPIIPHMGIFTLGLATYKFYYYKRMSIFGFSFENKFVSLIGRHSLLVYFIHQPIILGAMNIYILLFK
ncbi:heparan-alpha-glucosaminide N-acetyltransferase [Proteinivorax hydrogeniformans]|uniref:Heparan-alpha-glucosaminide N-acetyltransferase n=1 Tax=Proteinivorax hydrogeniformans TaxID=1826727 RepID=A0AAU8HVH3_9FIRM